MKVEELAAMRTGVEIDAMRPYVQVEVDGMQRAVVNAVTMMVNEGTLTPEIAHAKWMEYIAYRKLLQRFDQKIKAGTDIGKAQNLDLKGK